MDPIIYVPGGYKLDESGNFQKWKTEKERLRQRLLNRVIMRREAFVIQGYEDTGCMLYRLNKVLPSEREQRAREYVDEALKPEVEAGEITSVSDVALTDLEKGKYQLSISVELPNGEIIDLEVNGDYGGV